MSQAYVALPYRAETRKRCYTTLSLICDDECLSDAQIKAYQTRLQEYRTFLDAVSRLALCGNVCVTEEAVTIGEHGLLTGESLNALQHAGAISVYNTLQQNNWEFPVSEEGEVAIVKAHVSIPDEFLDSEKPIRSDWPAVHISECFVEGERAKLHGSVRPLRTFLPPTIVFRNAADVDEELEPELEVNVINSGPEGSIEIVQSSKGLSVKKLGKDGKTVVYIPIEEYYFGRQEGNSDYVEEKGDFRFKCAVCQRIFYSNTKLMSHILGHVDETSQTCLEAVDITQCSVCNQVFSCAFDLRDHIEKEHTVLNSDANSTNDEMRTDSTAIQTTSQLLMQQCNDDPLNGGDTATSTGIIAPNLNNVCNTPSCRICGKLTTSEILLAHHLQSSHRQREMPYVCRLCLFRSSMYEDILEHFKKVHDSSNHLLCTYCLRIFTPSDARSNIQSLCGLSTPGSGGFNKVGLGMGIGQTQVYLQHLRMHQINHQLRRCPTCRLNFTNKSDYQVHRRLDHKATQGPGIDKHDPRRDLYELESYRTSGNDGTTAAIAGSHSNERNRVHHVSTDSVRIIRPQITSMNAPEAGCTKSLTVNFFPENIQSFECLECGKCMGDAEHIQYLPCSVCRFATCCRIGFQRHYQNCISIQIHHSQSMLIQNNDNFQCPTTTTSTTTTNVTTEQTPSIVISGSQELLVINEITDLTPNCLTNTSSIMPSDEITLNNNNNNLLTEKATCQSLLPIRLSLNDCIMKYMERQYDSYQFYCSHCGVNNLDGNSLARHLVEECGTLTATLNPHPCHLVTKSQSDIEITQQKQQEINQNGNTILIESTEQNIVVMNQPSVLSTNTENADADVIMMTIDGDDDEHSSIRLVESTDNSTSLLTDNQIISQMNGTTTIDITDAGGEVVQQFILPDDLQLEEGQTLVMIQGENGQPQLAIVNQSDLITADGSEIIMQTEDEQDNTNNILIYTNDLQSQTQQLPDDGIDLLRGGDEEKENQQFIV
ncbi:unnamed protein product [Heterobilharzia americana]|nr:unnamed protein product [Heterobilharzia americana]